MSPQLVVKVARELKELGRCGKKTFDSHFTAIYGMSLELMLPVWPAEVMQGRSPLAKSFSVITFNPVEIQKKIFASSHFFYEYALSAVSTFH